RSHRPSPDAPARRRSQSPRSPLLSSSSTPPDTTMAHPRRHGDQPLARRDTLNGMETPGSATSAPGMPETGTLEATPLQADTPGAGTPETGTPETGTVDAASGPVWRFLIAPRWLGWHLLVVLAFWGMLWLG